MFVICNWKYTSIIIECIVILYELFCPIFPVGAHQLANDKGSRSSPVQVFLLEQTVDIWIVQYCNQWFGSVQKLFVWRIGFFSWRICEQVSIIDFLMCEMCNHVGKISAQIFKAISVWSMFVTWFLWHVYRNKVGPIFLAYQLGSIYAVSADIWWLLRNQELKHCICQMDLVFVFLLVTSMASSSGCSMIHHLLAL